MTFGYKLIIDNNTRTFILQTPNNFKPLLPGIHEMVTHT